LLFKSQENTFVKVGLRCCCLKKGQIFYFAAFEFLIFEPCRQVGNLCSMFCLMFVREKLSLFRKPQNFFSLQAAFEPRWRHYNNINLVKSFQLFGRSVHFGQSILEKADLFWPYFGLKMSARVQCVVLLKLLKAINGL